MSSYALFRLPFSRQYTLVRQVQGEPLELPSPHSLGDAPGFVVAPFCATDDCPIVLIRPDEVQVHPVPPADARRDGGDESCGHAAEPHDAGDELHDAAAEPHDDAEDRRRYGADFRAFHAELRAGHFAKLVLARQASLPPYQGDAAQLFVRACQRYPRLFVALVSTPRTGTWLVATPELLLQREEADRWRTVALAGTMQLGPDELGGEGEQLTWSVKNIQEQRFVASYIADTLQRHGLSYQQEGPRTVRAAQLVHLRSDFVFLYNNKCTRVGTLLHALHPTPAVCGLPKERALSFILSHEHADRRYYSGFMGPLCLADHGTHLFVSLRCMELTADACHLYAGGGLLPDSTEEHEWQETEAKLLTMRQLLQAGD